MKSYTTYVGPTNIMAVGSDASSMGHAVGLYFNTPAPVEEGEEPTAPAFCGVNYVLGGDGMMPDEVLRSLLAMLITLEGPHIDPKVVLGMDQDFHDQLASQDLSVSDAGLFRAFFGLPTVLVDGKLVFDTESEAWAELLDSGNIEAHRAP